MPSQSPRACLRRGRTGIHASTTKLSTRGQLVIPEAIRAPGFDQFEELLARARGAVAAAAVEPADIEQAIERARDDDGR